LTASKRITIEKRRKKIVIMNQEKVNNREKYVRLRREKE